MLYKSLHICTIVTLLLLLLFYTVVLEVESFSLQISKKVKRFNLNNTFKIDSKIRWYNRYKYIYLYIDNKLLQVR